MISKPTTPKLIDAVCTELANKVAPVITDATVKVQLEMALSILQGASVRSANELAWMHEECVAIEETAQRLVAELPNAAPLADAMRTYIDGKTDSRFLADAQANYERASEVLSCATEAAYASGNADHIAAVDRLFDQRHANQNAVTGQFQAVGRT
jgi:hypothetical protein